MTTCLGKSCSFGLPRVPFVNCCQFMYLVVSPFGLEGRMWDMIASVPDHCLSFYLGNMLGFLDAGLRVSDLPPPGQSLGRDFKPWSGLHDLVLSGLLGC